MAIALCSLLLGELYDAYVVSGHATQDITENIRIRTDCPVKPEELEDEETVCHINITVERRLSVVIGEHLINEKHSSFKLRFLL